MKKIYDKQEWIFLCNENRLWRDSNTPYKAYDRSMRLRAEWDKYKESGWIKLKK